MSERDKCFERNWSTLLRFVEEAKKDKAKKDTEALKIDLEYIKARAINLLYLLESEQDASD